MSAWIVGSAIVVGGVVAAGASMESSSKAADAQNNATAANAAAQGNSLAAQQANFQTVQNQEAPYRDFGTQNMPQLQQMLSGGYNMQQSPSAQYAMLQGSKAINSSMQARGLEGNAVAQMGQLSSSTAATDYQNRFNQLLAATNIGSNAVAMTGSGTNALNSNIQSSANTSGLLGQSGAQNMSSIYGLQGATAGNLAGSVGGGLARLFSPGAGDSSSYNSSTDNLDLSPAANGYRGLSSGGLLGTTTEGAL